MNLREKINNAITKKFGDPKDRFKIEKLYEKNGKKIAEVYVQWDINEGEHLGVIYE